MSYFKPKKFPLSFLLLWSSSSSSSSSSSFLNHQSSSSSSPPLLFSPPKSELNLPSNVASPVTAPAVASIVCLFLGLPSKTVQGQKKKHCWMCELLFIRPAKCLYRVPCTLQKHNILYDCMWKQIKLPSKWRCCWIRVSRRSCCWSCKIKCHEKSLNCYKIILKQYYKFITVKNKKKKKFLTGIEIKIV